MMNLRKWVLRIGRFMRTDLSLWVGFVFEWLVAVLVLLCFLAIFDSIDLTPLLALPFLVIAWVYCKQHNDKARQAKKADTDKENSPNQQSTES